MRHSLLAFLDGIGDAAILVWAVLIGALFVRFVAWPLWVIVIRAAMEGQ